MIYEIELFTGFRLPFCKLSNDDYVHEKHVPLSINMIFFSMTDKPTDKINHVLCANWLGKSLRIISAVLNNSRENHVVLVLFLTDRQMVILNYRVDSVLKSLLEMDEKYINYD